MKQLLRVVLHLEVPLLAVSEGCTLLARSELPPL